MDLVEFLKVSISADPKQVAKLIDQEIEELEKEFELAAEREDIYKNGYIAGKISGLRISKLLAETMNK